MSKQKVLDKKGTRDTADQLGELLAQLRTLPAGAWTAYNRNGVPVYATQIGDSRVEADGGKYGLTTEIRLIGPAGARATLRSGQRIRNFVAELADKGYGQNSRYRTAGAGQ